MPVAKQAEIAPAEGKLGVLLVGLGAVSTTFIAGVEAIKKGFAQPIGSLTQMGTIRLGKRTDNRVPLIKDLVPLADLKDLVFGAWDIFPDSAYDAALNAGVRENHKAIAPSMIYAYAALKSGIPFANGAPNLTVDIPALMSLADKNKLAICGKDFKTGQTLMKTIIAPGLKSSMLGLHGWYSTNILGNRDGEVLDDPDSFKTKEESKLSVLEYILQPEVYPDLYKDFSHVVRINYYPPRGDNKEGWDAIDIFGWLGYKMQIKIDFLCRDSILAAPLALDLALFMDLAQRSGMKGILEWLSFYFKSPMTAAGLYPEHDLFIQHAKLQNTLRHLQGETLITHLGLRSEEHTSE